jgi:hypothetical protein
MRPEFDVHILNDTGLEKARQLGTEFSELLNNVEQICGSLNNGREMALVRTKLQEASYYAKRALALNPDNQAGKPTP